MLLLLLLLLLTMLPLLLVLLVMLGPTLLLLLQQAPSVAEGGERASSAHMRTRAGKQERVAVTTVRNRRPNIIQPIPPDLVHKQKPVCVSVPAKQANPSMAHRVSAL
jgi:hypothetical protein